MCVTKYVSKGTQKEDSSPFQSTMKVITRRIEKQVELQQDEEESAELPVREGLKRLLGAVMASSSNHVVSAPLAWCLTSKKSRFRFSHEFQFMPVQDFADIADEKLVKIFLVCQNKDSMIPTNSAFEYLNRPQSLENVSACEHFQKFKAVSMSRSVNCNNSLLRFLEADDPKSQEGTTGGHDLQQSWT